MRRAGLGVLATLVVLAAASSAGGAPAGKGVFPDTSGDAHGKLLTKAELAAVDIVSTKIFADPRFGLVASVTFRGNFQNAVGKGHLKNAYAALILRPKAGVAGKPAMVVSTGPGAGKIYRHTKTTNVNVIRNGRKLTFAVLGPGADLLGSVQVKVSGVRHVFAGPRAAAGLIEPPFFGDVLAGDLLDDYFYDNEVVAYGPLGFPLTCADLGELLDEAESGDLNLSSADYDSINQLYEENCAPPKTALQVLFPNPPVCFIDKGKTTIARFSGIHLVVGDTFPGDRLATPPATGTLRLQGPSFDQNNTLTFAANGVASDSDFTLSAFGDYGATATVTAGGQTATATASFHIDATNDVTTCPGA